VSDDIKHEWPLFEVFVRAKRGLNHVHVGSLRAADHQMALHRSDGVVSSGPDDKEAFFAPSGDKVYRHPTYYAIPDSVPHI
jgi:ring-1,2-phenylacetyl-CoA epoxidase subunit PaaB